jgi:TetR/AcrR family transcriptional regulator, biofilm operon repressor
MKCKIIAKATEMFLKIGFKSVTMDDIAKEMCISKKTIYKYFENKELLITEGAIMVHEKIHETITKIVSENYNAIQENFEIRKMFKEMFTSIDNSPVYQLKKHYPEIHDQFMCRETEECNMVFRQNVIKGIEQGLYRENINIDSFVKFYYTIIFSINENTKSEKEVFALEYDALEYHTRALATAKGVIELEKQLSNPNI